MSETETAAERRPGESEQELQDRQALDLRMSRIRHKLLVLSGKGGVGKSTVAANLALTLAQMGHRVGLLDIDIHGPSIPRLLGLVGRRLEGGPGGLRPISVGENLKVMSIAFLLDGDRDAVIWRGPMKYGVIKQFLKDVEWGDLDFLVVDSPPGTGDEPLSVAQLIQGADGAVVVTTPQEVSLGDVRRSITFCQQLNLPVLGLVENMSGFICPHCGEATDIFGRGGGERLALETGVPLLGRIPLDPAVVESSDQGTTVLAHKGDSETVRRFQAVVAELLKAVKPE